MSRVAEVETFSKPGVGDVTPADYKKIAPIVRHYAKMAHPFTACKRDQLKHGLSEDHANRRCAVVKALGGRGAITEADLDELPKLTRSQMNAIAEEAWFRLDIIEAELGEGTVKRLLSEAVLSAKTRKDLPASAFVFPKDRRYPIHDKAHARNALSRSAGKPEEGTVRSAVHSRYPDLKKTDKAKMSEAEVLRVELAEEVYELYAVIEGVDRPTQREGVWRDVAAEVLKEAERNVSAYTRTSKTGKIINVSSYRQQGVDAILKDIASHIGKLTPLGEDGPSRVNFPDGVNVSAERHQPKGPINYAVRGGQIPEGAKGGDTVGSVEHATAEAAHRSATSTHPDSIGGKKAYRYAAAVPDPSAEDVAKGEAGRVKNLSPGDSMILKNHQAITREKNGAYRVRGADFGNDHAAAYKHAADPPSAHEVSTGTGKAKRDAEMAKGGPTEEKPKSLAAERAAKKRAEGDDGGHTKPGTEEINPRGIPKPGTGGGSKNGKVPTKDKGGDYSVRKSPGAINNPDGHAQSYEVTGPDGKKTDVMALSPQAAQRKVAGRGGKDTLGGVPVSKPTPEGTARTKARGEVMNDLRKKLGRNPTHMEMAAEWKRVGGDEKTPRPPTAKQRAAMGKSLDDARRRASDKPHTPQPSLGDIQRNQKKPSSPRQAPSKMPSNFNERTKGLPTRAERQRSGQTPSMGDRQRILAEELKRAKAEMTPKGAGGKGLSGQQLAAAKGLAKKRALKRIEDLGG